MIKSLTSSHLKTIAIIAMALDHFVAIFINHNTQLGMLLRVSGRIVAPIMCFLIAEGFYKTSNVNKYLFRLFVFALISHIPYNVAFGYSFFQATSVMWGLFLGLLALKIIKSDNIHIFVRITALVLCCAFSITADWSYVCVLWIVGFGIFYGDFKKQMIAFCTISILAHIVPTFLNFGLNHGEYPHWYQFGVFLAIPFFCLYNGNRGNDMLKIGRYGFYIFYPAHLLILYLINIFTPLKVILSEVIK